MSEPIDWRQFGWTDWAEVTHIRDHLAAGADPNSLVAGNGRPLHEAARHGHPDVVAELAAAVRDVDDVDEGRTALWVAVHARRPRNARALVAAGADPWRPMMSGWSPGRLSLAGPTPDLFDVPAGVTLSPDEAAAAAESRRLLDVLGQPDLEGYSVGCVAGIDAAEAARRLRAVPVPEDELGFDPDGGWDYDEDLRLIGATTVDGGCIVIQPWGYAPSMDAVVQALSVGTVCYAFYANPKSGDQGMIYRDGNWVGSDLQFGADPPPDAPADEVLASFLYPYESAAYACGRAGVRPVTDAPVVGPAESWWRLPAALVG